MTSESEKLDAAHRRARDSKPSSRKPLIIILVVSVLPILLAYTMYFTGVGVPSETKNNGYLVSPAIHLSDIKSAEVDTLLENWKDDIKWRIMVPLFDTCNAACQQNVYTTRQVHTRLGEKSIRLDRIAVNISGQPSNSYYEAVKSEHPDLAILTVTPQAWDAWINNANIPQYSDGQHYYILVNQENFAMLWYNQDIKGNDLLKDIKHALKYSPDFQK